MYDQCSQRHARPIMATRFKLDLHNVKHASAITGGCYNFIVNKLLSVQKLMAQST